MRKNKSNIRKSGEPVNVIESRDLETSAGTRPSPSALAVTLSRWNHTSLGVIRRRRKKSFDISTQSSQSIAIVFSNFFGKIETSSIEHHTISNHRFFHVYYVRVEGKLFFQNRSNIVERSYPTRNRIAIGNITRNGIETVSGVVFILMHFF